MVHSVSFPPIARPDARVLILGSMPGRESLARQRYYAHPRNAFWPILTSLLDMEAANYPQCVEEVTQHGIAIWDVLRACFRRGSLDADIDSSSMVPNDFEQFFGLHPHIQNVFFNGAKAESVYRKNVLPGLVGAHAAIPLQRLPSTSPAHASMSLEQKKQAWQVITASRVK